MSPADTPARGRVLAATETFGVPRPDPVQLLEQAGFALVRNPYNRRLTREDYAACLDGVDYVIAGLEPYDRPVFERFPGLKAISRIGIGLDAIDLDGARARGVSVFNTPAAPSRSVAEEAIGFMLCLARGLAGMNAAAHQREWKPWLGRELAALTIGLVGLGRIGRLVAERLEPFGAALVGTDPRWDEIAPPPCVRRRSLPDLLREADIVSVHVPLQPDTRHLVDGAALDLMKPGSFLVNTARGGIVDDAALIERLRSGRIGGAALDVMESEPDLSAYAGVPNLLLTPHVGSNTAEGRYRMEMGAVENLIRYVESRERGDRAVHSPTP